MVWERKESKAAKEVFKSLVKSMQGRYDFDIDAAEFLGQLISWFKLSKVSEVEEQSLFNNWVSSADPKQSLHDSWKSWNDVNSSKYGKCKFSWNEDIVARYDNDLFSNLWASFHSAYDKGVLNFDNAFFHIMELVKDEVELQRLPYEVAMLMLHLADPGTTESIYCPFNSSLPLAALTGRFFENVFFESSESTSWPCMQNILEDASIQSRKSDPVESPGWIEKGNLCEFDITLAYPPQGKKYKDVEDWFQRLPESRYFRGEIYQLHHILAQTKEKAVVLVADSFLQRTAKAETEFRKYILEMNWLDVVIRLGRHGKYFSNTPMSLLVLNKKRIREDVMFIDSEHANITTSSEGEQTTLTSIDDSSIVGDKAIGENYSLSSVVELYRNYCSNKEFMPPDRFKKQRMPNDDDDLQGFRSVKLDELMREKYSLDVYRYVLTTDEDNVYYELRNGDTIGLGHISTLIRPRSVRRTDGKEIGEKYSEVALMNVPNAGYIKIPQRIIYVDARNSKTADKQKLKAHDILLSVKGTIGKIGIVPKDKQGIWLANQSFQIIRVSGGKRGIDPRVLYTYLKSGMAQVLLNKRIYGASVPMIQKKDLEALPIPVLSKEKQKEIIKSFEEEVRLKSEIDELEERIKELNKGYWSLGYEIEHDDDHT